MWPSSWYSQSGGSERPIVSAYSSSLRYIFSVSKKKNKKMICPLSKGQKKKLISYTVKVKAEVNRLVPDEILEFCQSVSLLISRSVYFIHSALDDG